MKAIVIVATVLSLLMNFAHADVATPEPAEQHEKNIEMCTQNLLAIDKAIEGLSKGIWRFSSMAFRSASEALGRCECAHLSLR